MQLSAGSVYMIATSENEVNLKAAQRWTFRPTSHILSMLPLPLYKREIRNPITMRQRTSRAAITRPRSAMSPGRYPTLEGDGIATAAGGRLQDYTCRTASLSTQRGDNWDRLTRYDLNREGSCSKLSRRDVDRSELHSEHKPTSFVPVNQRNLFFLCARLIKSHLKREGLRLHDSLQDHEAVRGHVDVAAVLNLVLHIWIHTLTHTRTHTNRRWLKGFSQYLKLLLMIFNH